MGPFAAYTATGHVVSSGIRVAPAASWKPAGGGSRGRLPDDHGLEVVYQDDLCRTTHAT